MKHVRQVKLKDLTEGVSFDPFSSLYNLQCNRKGVDHGYGEEFLRCDQGSGQGYKTFE